MKDFNGLYAPIASENRLQDHFSFCPFESRLRRVPLQFLHAAHDRLRQPRIVGARGGGGNRFWGLCRQTGFLLTRHRLHRRTQVRCRLRLLIGQLGGRGRCLLRCRYKDLFYRSFMFGALHGWRAVKDLRSLLSSIHRFRRVRHCRFRGHRSRRTGVPGWCWCSGC